MTNVELRDESSMFGVDTLMNINVCWNLCCFFFTVGVYCHHFNRRASAIVHSVSQFSFNLKAKGNYFSFTRFLLALLYFTFAFTFIYNLASTFLLYFVIIYFCLILILIL